MVNSEPAVSPAYPAWRSVRNQFRNYAPRRPEESTLYRIVFHFRQQFEYAWDELFMERYGVLRDEVLRAFDRYLDCGVLLHGCAVACCDNARCDHLALIAFSCKRRGLCPSCQAKRALLFAENLGSNVLYPYPHRHLVFSLPKRLRVYFRFDRSLFSHLYRAAWETWSEYVATTLSGAKPGAVMALHTAGSLLNWHPHIHAIVLDGGLLDDGAFLKISKVDADLMKQRFAEKVFAFLLDTQLIDKDTVDSMKAWEHSGFGFFAGEPIAPDNRNSRLFLARYLKKAPLILSQLAVDDSGNESVVHYSKHGVDSDSDEKNLRSFSPLEFMAELACHIPRVFEQTTRYFGAYSPRTRGAKQREKRFKTFLQNNFQPLDDLSPPTPPSESWARSMKSIFELNPLLCPKCGTEMKIRSFILSSHEIEQLCKKLGLICMGCPELFIVKA